MNIPKQFLFIINQIFELEKKVVSLKEPNSIHRNIDKLKNYFESEALSEGQGLVYFNPIGESYNTTRTDCEATISGDSCNDLVIVEVLKPIIYAKLNNTKVIVQKAIVIVQEKK